MEIPQQALALAFARGIAADSPAFFGVEKTLSALERLKGFSVGKKDCPKYYIIQYINTLLDCRG